MVQPSRPGEQCRVGQASEQPDPRRARRGPGTPWRLVLRAVSVHGAHLAVGDPASRLAGSWRGSHAGGAALACLEVAIGLQVRVCLGHHAARDRELGRERPARRQRGPRGQAAILDSGAEGVLKALAQAPDTAGPDVDQEIGGVTVA